MNNNVPEFDHGQARKEGWDIWDTCEAGDRRFQLQAVNDPSDWHKLGLVDYTDPKFEDDGDAWAFVAGKAREGSDYHRMALNYLRENSPQEYEAIVETALLEGQARALTP